MSRDPRNLPRGPVRAAFLTPSLLMGGAERWMISLGRCCDRARVSWTGTALTQYAWVSAALCIEMSVFMPVFGGPANRSISDAGGFVRLMSAHDALGAALDGADVLLAWGVGKPAELVERLDARVVFVAHGCPPGAARSVGAREAGAADLVAVSESACRVFSRELRSRVTILHNGIDVPRCTPTRSRDEVRAAWGVRPHDRLVGYVGRYASEKNPTAAARAVARLGGGARAIYAGTGWMEEALRREAERIAPGRVRFVPVDRQVGNVLCALDVFVLASPAEGFSLSMAEAWYCGVPVVATRVGAVPELERRHGPLVSPVPVYPQARDLAGAVERALDPEFRRDVVPRARQAVAAHYTAGAMAARWTEYLESIVRSASATGGQSQNGSPEGGRSHFAPKTAQNW